MGVLGGLVFVKCVSRSNSRGFCECVCVCVCVCVFFNDKYNFHIMQEKIVCRISSKPVVMSLYVENF